jgi:hypothetical protein
MSSRLDLHEELCEILGSRNVYFQPPSSVKMKYPCIRYSSDGNSVRHANNKVYKNVKRYEGVVIDSNPDSTIPDAMLEHFEMCSLGSGYTADNLNHFPFTLYY